MCVHGREVDQTGVGKVLEQSHVVEQDKRGECGPQEASTKSVTYTKTFL